MPLRDRLSDRQLRIVRAASRLGNVLFWDGDEDTSMSQVMVAHPEAHPWLRAFVDWVDEGHMAWTATNDPPTGDTPCD